MDDDPQVNLRSIFNRALDREAGPERSAFLDDACGGDATLRERIDALLMALDRAGGFLAEATVAETIVQEGDHPGPSEAIDPLVDSASWGPLETAGTSIGPYKLLQAIGEGGMGQVFMAEQEKPVRRRVALKVIKAGMDSAQVVARFEAERQALALMDHPNIAKVLDAGATATGRPFFVMELVKGIPITSYCDQARLNPRQRLELFIPVCQAIQHAHQKGIIHRDIKPSNVLVTLVDGKPVPKVIDFGVAKAIEQRLTERTLFTQLGAIVGTPEYMSPEQAGISSQDVDTRSDVYSLGVLLYELLTGSTPLDRETLRRAAFAEILKRIREEEPPRPSTRLSGSGDRLAGLSAVRNVEPSRLTRLVRGDLDWIVMKALEKDRSRRYESATGFVRDIQRYLDGDAVEARPPSRRYRLGKFARKHRSAMIVVTTFVVLLTAATAISTTSAIVAGRATKAAKDSEKLAKKDRDRALEAEAKMAVALADAGRARDQSERVVDLLIEAFRSPDPMQDGESIRVVDVLDQGLTRLGDGATLSRQVRGALLDALGRTYQGLGLFEKGVAVLTRALADREATLGPRNLDTMRTMHALALSHRTAGRGREAAEILGRAIDRARPSLAPDDPTMLDLQDGLIAALLAQRRSEEARALAEQVLILARARLGEDSGETLTIRGNLAAALMQLGRFNDAIPLLRENIARWDRTIAPDRLEAIAARNNLIAALLEAGRPREGIALGEQTDRLVTKRFGPTHPLTLLGRKNVATLYMRSGNPDRAIPILEETYRLMKIKPGPEHPSTLAGRNLLAEAYRATRRWADAEPLHRDIVARLRREGNVDRLSLAAELLTLGQIVLNQEKWTDAEQILRESLGLFVLSNPESFQAFLVRSLLGGALVGLRRFEEAEPLVIEGYEGMLKHSDQIAPPIANMVLGDAADRAMKLYDAWGKPEPSVRWWEIRRKYPRRLPANVFVDPSRAAPSR